MNKIIDLYFSPGRVFRGLKEKPEWIVPLIVVLIVLAIISLLTISSTRDLISARQEEAMKERGMTDEQIELARKISSGPILFASAGIGSIITTLIILLIFAGILNVLVTMLGGEGSFKSVFSVISYSALVKIPGNTLRFILILLKHSLDVSTSFTLFFPGLATNSFAYKLLNGFDFFILWEMALVAYGISITNNLKKENAYVLVFALWIASIFLGLGLGSVFGYKGG